MDFLLKYPAVIGPMGIFYCYVIDFKKKDLIMDPYSKIALS